MVCNSSKTKQKGGFAGSCCDQIFGKNKSKWTSKHHFDALSEVQKDLEDISEGIGTFLKILYIKILLEFDIKVGVVNFDLTLYN